LKNREHLNAWSRDYYHKHRERKREYLREWSKRSPRRRLIFQKWERCGRLCYICGKDLPKVEIVVDHVVPSIKGGPNHISNLMPTHNRCNCKKNDKLNYSFARPDLLEIANG
jgi:5-methylcytosine-specific restriction endonuclease McrA